MLAVSGAPLITGGALAVLGGCALLAVGIWRGEEWLALQAGGLVVIGILLSETGKRVPY